MSTDAAHVAIVGAGTIGVGWSVVFARAGIEARAHETSAERRDEAAAAIERTCVQLASEGLLDEEPAAIAARVRIVEDLDEAVVGARHVQECIGEAVEAKRRLLATVLDIAPDVSVASSTSSMTASALASGLAGRERVLVAHPGNPPYLLPIVELAPAPFTAPEIVDAVDGLLTEAGMVPVRIGREIEGLVFNRLQAALLREAYCLVRDGVISAEDLDRVVTEGPGRRWPIIGPFATAELNTRGGVVGHAALLGPAYQRMGAERGQDDPWTSDLVETVAASVHRRLLPDRRDEHLEARDRALMAIARVRATIPVPGADR